MRLNRYLTEAKKGDTSLTTFFHEVGTAVFLKDKSASIESGADILPYFEKGLVVGVNPGLAKVPVSDMLKRFGKQFSDNSKAKPAIIKDAKKIADNILRVVGKPKGAVWWTGPTNDASRLGAADIFFMSGSEEVPISLKYGTGQLKNLGLKNIGDILLKGVLKKGQDLTKVLDDEEYKQYWDGMTKGWMKFLYDTSISQDDEAFENIIGKHLNIDWNGYLKYKFSPEETEYAELALYALTGKEMALKGPKASLRYVCRKYYEQFGSKGNVGWTKIKEHWFGKLFGSFFKDKEELINKNLKEIFRAQMSAGETPMWYAAQGGKKIMFIPSAKKLESVSNKLLSFSYNDVSVPTGYRISLEIKRKAGGKLIALITIDINIRWKDGQMNGKPTSASDMKLHIKDEEWNKIFNPKNTGIGENNK